MPQPKTFKDVNGKVWNTEEFDDTRYWEKPKKQNKNKPARRNLLGKT